MILSRSEDLEFVSLPGRLSADPFAGWAEAEGMSVRVVRITAHGPRSPHRHPRSAEAVYVVAGRGRAWIDGETARVAEGDAFLVPRGTPHVTVPDSGSSLSLVCFFPDGDLPSNTEELSGEPLAPARPPEGG